MRSTLTSATILVAALALPGEGRAQDIEARLQAADAGVGERLFRQCQACHTIEKDGPNRTGPNLYGVIGRPVGTAEGFRYTKQMQAFGGEWSPERLDTYLADPRGTVPGTRMVFRGIADPADRASVIAYLNTNSDTPLDLGPASADGEAEAGSDDGEQDFGQLVVAPGAEVTYYTCTACHSEMIVAQQGKTRAGWDKLFDWMIEEQGMPELDQEDRDVILDYLAEHYNTDRPNFPRR